MASSHGRFVWYELATTDMEGLRRRQHLLWQRTAVLAGMKENGAPPL
jgi:hypothetical protein